MASFWRENQLVRTKKKLMVWRTKVFFNFFLLFSFTLAYSKFVSMEDMLWIEDIVGNTRTPLFLTNFRIDMIGFVDPHMVIVKRIAFSAFPSAQNES